MSPFVAVVLNGIMGLIIAKIGYGMAGPLNAERHPIIKALIAVALYFVTIFTLPWDAQLVFAALAIGFAIACAQIAIRQTRAQMAADAEFEDTLGR